MCLGFPDTKERSLNWFLLWKMLHSTKCSSTAGIDRILFSCMVSSLLVAIFQQQNYLNIKFADIVFCFKQAVEYNQVQKTAATAQVFGFNGPGTVEWNGVVIIKLNGLMGLLLLLIATSAQRFNDWIA